MLLNISHIKIKLMDLELSEKMMDPDPAPLNCTDLKGQFMKYVKI